MSLGPHQGSDLLTASGNKGHSVGTATAGVVLRTTLRPLLSSAGGEPQFSETHTHTPPDCMHVHRQTHICTHSHSCSFTHCRAVRPLILQALPTSHHPCSIHIRAKSPRPPVLGCGLRKTLLEVERGITTTQRRDDDTSGWTVMAEVAPSHALFHEWIC